MATQAQAYAHGFPFVYVHRSISAHEKATGVIGAVVIGKFLTGADAEYYFVMFEDGVTEVATRYGVVANQFNWHRIDAMGDCTPVDRSLYPPFSQLFTNAVL